MLEQLKHHARVLRSLEGLLRPEHHTSALHTFRRALNQGVGHVDKGTGAIVPRVLQRTLADGRDNSRVEASQSPLCYSLLAIATEEVCRDVGGTWTAPSSLGSVRTTHLTVSSSFRPSGSGSCNKHGMR